MVSAFLFTRLQGNLFFFGYGRKGLIYLQMRAVYTVEYYIPSLLLRGDLFCSLAIFEL